MNHRVGPRAVGYILVDVPDDLDLMLLHSGYFTADQLTKAGLSTEFNELKGIGHIPHWEQPDKFNEVLDGVLDRLKQAPERVI
jgi:pimeloyl-ACP methyl ester carboxylesterase